jgi:flagellin-like hook-associated protein FlgL
MLYDRILHLKDAKFDGARLFSPDHNLVTNNLDTDLINGSAEPIDKYPLEYRNERIKKLELIFVVDTTMSMGPTIDGLRNNISSFINTVEEKTDSWEAKVVNFTDVEFYGAPVARPFVNNLAALQSQLSSLSLQNGIDYPESLIDGIGAAFASTDWSNNSDSVKGIIAFTDAASKLPISAYGTSSEIAEKVKNAGVKTEIYGYYNSSALFNSFNQTPANSFDPVTQGFVAASGASLNPYAASSNMASALGGFFENLIQVESGLVDYDTITRYIAENTTKQQTVSNLIDSAETFGANVKAALGQIQDLDVAKESIIKARYEILQDAGTAILAQANQSVNATLTLLT